MLRGRCAIGDRCRTRWFAAASLLVLAACSSSVEPRNGITVLVTNGSCLPGPCTTQQVLAFPSHQPSTPGGNWSLDLGMMNGPNLCITLPDSTTFRVIGTNTDGSADTTKIIWTTAMPIALGVQAPSTSRIFASPSTSEFVPARSAGWSVTLPGESRVTPSSPCDPQGGQD